MKNLCSPLFFVLALSATLYTSNAQAYCADKLSQNHSVDARHFSFESYIIEDWAALIDQDFFVDNLQTAQMAMTFLYQSLYCQDAPKIDLENSACSEVKAGRSFSTQCYIETNDGYFFVYQDLMNRVHLNYHRWD